jgi:hypothetical protein
MSYDYAIHSDYLIHWTGRDIDECDSNWHVSDKSKTDGDVGERYLVRLRDILAHGLWMTEEAGWSPAPTLTIPPAPVCCFTELKVSESRRHARQYGRLGIGVKRSFLFDRLGRPLCYFGFGQASNDVLLQSCARDLSNKSLLHFFKPMNSSTTTLNYDYYSESEWRILFLEQLLQHRLIVDPRDPANRREHQYFLSLTEAQQRKLRYLIPLDGWFQMIIYPSLTVKNEAQKNSARCIREEIARIKSLPDHGNKVESGNWPIETNLDACRNF